MMVMLNILFFAALAVAAVVVVWLVWSATILVFVRKRPKRWIRRLSWILVGLPASAVITAISIGCWYWHATRPDVEFEAEFGMPPPAGTVVFQSSSFALGDSGNVYFHFHTSRTTINKIISSMGFVSRSDNFSTNVIPPSWFLAGHRSNAERYYFDRSQTGTTRPAGARFESEHAKLSYDPQSGEAWYWYSGLD